MERKRNQEMGSNRRAAKTIWLNIAENGKRVIIENVDGSTTGAKLKGIICEKVGIEPEDQLLVHYHGKPILNEQTIGELEIVDEIVILLFKPLKKSSTIFIDKEVIIVDETYTIKTLRSFVEEGKLFYRGSELRDKTKSLSYHQVHEDANLKVYRQAEGFVTRLYVKFNGRLEQEGQYDVYSDMSVRDLKKEIEDDLDYTIREQRLFFNEIEMIDDLKIIAYCKAPPEGLDVRLENIE